MIKCFSCSQDFLVTRFNPENLCYDPNVNRTLASEMETRCPRSSKFCTTEIVTLNTVLIKVSRGCGGSTCIDNCVIQGFGLDTVTCTSCCAPIGAMSPYDFANEDDPVSVGGFPRNFVKYVSKFHSSSNCVIDMERKDEEEEI